MYLFLIEKLILYIGELCGSTKALLVAGVILLCL